jgi:hypothetical protein
MKKGRLTTERVIVLADSFLASDSLLGKKPKELIDLDSIDMESTSIVNLMRSTTKGGKLTKTEEVRQVCSQLFISSVTT